MSTSSISKIVNIDTEYKDDYDTDLEGDLIDSKEQYVQMTAYELYMDRCKQFKVVPVTSFCKQMLTNGIDLKFHSIGPTGIKALCAPLANNTTVTSLNLTENFMKAQGCEDLADMLTENCYITDLNISRNDIV